MGTNLAGSDKAVFLLLNTPQISLRRTYSGLDGLFGGSNEDPEAISWEGATSLATLVASSPAGTQTMTSYGAVSGRGYPWCPWRDSKYTNGGFLARPRKT